MYDWLGSPLEGKTSVSGGGSGRITNTAICGGEFEDLKQKIANLSKEEAEELYHYLKDQGVY